MIRVIGNLLMIFFLFVSIYALRDIIHPVAQKVGTYVESVIVYIEKQSGVKNFLPELSQQPEREIATPGPLETKPTTTEQQTPPSTGITKASIIYWTNVERKNNGNLPPLSENTTLTTTATGKTNDLFAQSYFEHTSPTGVTVADQVQKAGYEYIMIGENLALGTFASGQAIVKAWMESPGHRANILNDRYTQIGVGLRQGVYQGRTVWIATQHFGLPKNACPSVDESLRARIISNQARIEILEANIQAKRKEVESTSQLSENYNIRINEYNTVVKEFNALVVETKAEIATYNQKVQAYNQCVTQS